MAEEAGQLMQYRFMRAGLSEENAATLSECLVSTSLNGIDTHGFRLFPFYLSELENGRATPKPNMVFERNMGVSSVLDADNASGILAGMNAMQHAIDKAKDIGLAAVVVKNSNHFGVASNYTRLAAKQKCIGLCMSNSDALVSLHGGVDPFLGTNPISFSVPCGKGKRFDLDFATSQMAFSTISEYLALGKTLPSGWATDENGNDSSISKSVHALQPLGGYKGQGLGFMVQMLTSVLSGMPFDHQLSHLYKKPHDTPSQVSHFFLAINPEIFMDFEEFTQRVSMLIEEARKHTPAVIFPGENAMRSRKIREKDGIPLEQCEFELFEEIRGEMSNSNPPGK